MARKPGSRGHLRADSRCQGGGAGGQLVIARRFARQEISLALLATGALADDYSPAAIHDNEAYGLRQPKADAAARHAAVARSGFPIS